MKTKRKSDVADKETKKNVKIGRKRKNNQKLKKKTPKKKRD